MSRTSTLIGLAHVTAESNPLRPVFGQEIYRLCLDSLAEGKFLELEIREQLPESPGVDHCTREIVLAQASGLLQHGDIEVAHAAAGFLILLHQAGKLDGTGEPGRSGPDDHHVHLDSLCAWRVSQDQLVEGKPGLVPYRENRGQSGSWGFGRRWNLD